MVSSARARPGERSSRRGQPLQPAGLRRHTCAATAVHTRPRSTSGGGRVPARLLLSSWSSLRWLAAAERRPEQPPGPVGAALDRALRDPHQLGHLGDRPVLVHTSAATPPVPGCLPAPARRPRRSIRRATAPPRPDRRELPVPGHHDRQEQGRRAPAAQLQRGLPPGDAPQTRPRRALRPVAAGAVQTARKVSCSTSSTSARRSTDRSRAASHGACRPNSSRSAVSSPPATRATSSSSSIASLLHCGGARFTRTSGNYPGSAASCACLVAARR